MYGEGKSIPIVLLQIEFFLERRTEISENDIIKV